MAKLQRMYLDIIMKHGIFNKVAIDFMLGGGHYLFRGPDSKTHRHWAHRHVKVLRSVGSNQLLQLLGVHPCFNLQDSSSVSGHLA